MSESFFHQPASRHAVNEQAVIIDGVLAGRAHKEWLIVKSGPDVAGVQQKSKEQPDAKTITHALEPEMRSSFEAVGETVPQRRDEER